MVRHVAIIDIGKTNAKVALVDLETLSEIAVLRMPNRPNNAGPYPYHNVESLWGFILDSLAALAANHPVDAVTVTTHGATAALLDAAGALALPVLDYEHDGPDSTRGAYDAVRPSFAETGSPPLPLGLNLGAQLHWQAHAFPNAFAGVATILTYPQYWSWRLSGIAASEVTSLGCHTDLWNPAGRGFSTLVDALSWRSLFPPLRQASDTLGPILPEIAARTGLDPATPVICGIHDSNASLLPHLRARTPPFAVVSTGTWVVAMAIGGRELALDPVRDTLVNIDAFGGPVPSARFMGGREFELVMGDRAHDWTEDDLDAVLARPVMLLPSVQRGSGPFPDREAMWTRQASTDGERFLAASFYLALMTATCLELAGAGGEVLVEGAFVNNKPYLSMLSAATGRPTLPQAGHLTGTSVGAALLAGHHAGGMPADAPHSPDRVDALRTFARQWFDMIADSFR